MAFRRTSEVQINMNREEFYKWFDKSFMQKNAAGILVDNEWYDRVEKSHEEIRAKLGGVRKIQKIELDNVDPVCSWKDIAPYASHLYTLIPDYFSKYQIGIGDMVRPIIPKDKKPKGCKFGKHIATWISWNKKEIRGTEKDKTINDLICKIGGAWAAAKSRKDTLYVNISTSPVAFSYIGAYGPDNGSCFRQGAQNHHHKFILGQNQHTFVIIVSSKEQEETFNDANNIARIWGVCNSDMSEIILSNRYILQTYSQHGNINKAIEVAFSNITGLKYSTHNVGKGGIRIDGAYQNADTYALTTVKKDIKDKVVKFDITNFDSIGKCRNDGHFGQNGKTIFIVDGYYYCRICMEKMGAKFCEYSKTWTTKPLVEVFDKNYNKIRISQSILNNEFIKCSKTNEWHHCNNVISLDSMQWVSKRFLEKSNLKNCPYCNAYQETESFKINNDILEDIAVCGNCATIKKSKISTNAWASAY